MENKEPSGLSEELKAYLKVQYKIANLEAADKLSSAGSWVFSQSVLVFFIVCALFFLSLGASFYLGSVTGSIIKGFTLVGAFYVILFLFFFLFRRSTLKNPVRNRIIELMTEDLL